MKQALMKSDSVERFRTGEIYALPTVEGQNQLKRFASIEETAEQFGLSIYFIRQGVRAGWVPFIRCGNKAMVNVQKLAQLLDEQSVNGNFADK